MDKTPIVYAILALYGGLILRDLYTGTVTFQPKNWGRRVFNRRDDPFNYTVAMTTQVLILLALWGLVSLAVARDKADKADAAAQAAVDSTLRARRAAYVAERAGAGRPEDTAIVAQVVPFGRQRDSAFALARAGQPEEAIKIYDLILRNVEDPEILYWRGVAHWKLSRHDRAMDDLRRANVLTPDNYDVIVIMDRILSDRQEWDAILALWNPYIERNPTKADAFVERGGTNVRRRDFAAAAADFTKGCELGRSDACAAAQRARGMVPP